MQYLDGRGTGHRAGCESGGNVVWLTSPGTGRRRRSVDPIASLKQSVAVLTREIERSGKLRRDISAAVDARRYELYKKSVTSGMQADHSLVRAQQVHLNDVLKFVHAIAAARDPRAAESNPGARPDPLERSIRKLQASLKRAQQLSGDVLAQCRCRDATESRPRR